MENSEYFEYLQGRSRSGLWYRRYFLYPRLARHLHGDTLDVGCGIGDLVRFWPGMKGVDVNPESVAFCRSEGLDVSLMPFDKLPFAAATFDRLVLDNVLEHLDDPLLLLDEIVRVLRPGGQVIVGVPGRRGYAQDPDHKIFYDEPSLIGTLGKAGLRVRALFHTPLRSTFLERKLRQYCVYGVFERGSA